MKRFSILMVLGLLAAGTPASSSPIPPPPELWVMDADGTGQRRLGADGDVGWADDPAWSPDGTQLVMPGLRIFDVAGGEARELTNGFDRGPDWSPADEIVFSRTFSSETEYDERLYVIRPDGSGERLLVDTPALASSPSWSPDGNRVAFISGPGSGGEGQVFVVNADGTGLRQISTAGALYIPPEWSPDGTRLAFQTFGYHIYVVNANGSGERPLTNSGGYETDPSWCPNGRLAFSRQSDGTEPGIWLADGSELSFLTAGHHPDCGPDDRIAFVNNGDVHIVDPAEGGTPNLTSTSDRDDLYPLWSPDGSRIAFMSTPHFPPPTPVRRTVQASLRRHLVVRGTVTASNDVCLPRGPEVGGLKLQRLTESGWRTVRRTEVDESGRFRAKLPDRTGFYRVLARRSHASWGTYLCERAVTNPMEHRH